MGFIFGALTVIVPCVVAICSLEIPPERLERNRRRPWYTVY